MRIVCSLCNAFRQPEETSLESDAVIVKRMMALANNNEKLRSFKSKENIHKKEVWPYRGFGY